MTTKSLYDILSVTKDASTKEIKGAFRTLARDIHPDTACDKTDAENRFKEISNAYTILSNPRERARYDQGDIDETGSPLSKSKPADSPYDEFNKRRNQNTNAETRNIRIDGSDVFYILRVDFLDVVNGAVKHISMTNGRRIRVSIPRGTKNKQKLRLRGQGVPGAGGGKDGAALVEILIKDHSLFTIEGNDILLEQPIPLKLAILGGSLDVPSCSGRPITIQIPKNTSSGSTVRAPGQGIQPKDGDCGDQVVKLMITLPESGDNELTRFVQNWEPSTDTEQEAPRSATA